MLQRPLAYLLFIVALLLSQSCAAAESAAKPPAQAAVASAHPLASAAGHEILIKGGNAFDAAVAVSAVLAVVEPMGSGLGGGGFWLIHRAADDYETMIDGRERAPLAAHAAMYLDAMGVPVAQASLDGPKAAAVPGMPAALVHLSRRYGRLPLSKSLAPAIRIARRGFAVTARYQALARFRLAALTASPAAAKVFLDRGEVPATGFIIRQPDLANTLELIARKGRAGFYTGSIARRLVKAVTNNGGIWQLDDLGQYKIVERIPMRGSYHDMRLSTAALPSSGGIVMIQALNILEGVAIEQMPAEQRKHYVIEAMRRAYRDRARHLGDSDFVRVDHAALMSKQYAARLRGGISARASKSETMGDEGRPRGQDTTHFSIIDRDGNRVAATLSINYPFGSGFMPEGTGVVLNNEMDDFVIKPGVPNVYGLVGNRANAIAPGKRPLSSMTPTFIETKDKIIILGTPGGSRIISMVLLATLEAAAGRGGPGEWVALPRYHHQYLPDVVQHEQGALSEAELKALAARGHQFRPISRRYGNMQIVVYDKRTGQVSAASDPRGEGAALVK